MRNKMIVLLLTCLLVSASSLASAGVFSWELTNPVQYNVNPGDTVTFSGKLFNDTGADVWVSGTSIFADAGITIDDSIFYSYVELYPMAAGLTMWEGDLFTVTIDAGSALGTYGGSFGFTSDTGDPLGEDELFVVTSDTQPTVQAVPEPATLLGFGLPIVLVGFGKLRRMFGK